MIPHDFSFLFKILNIGFPNGPSFRYGNFFLPKVENFCSLAKSILIYSTYMNFKIKDQCKHYIRRCQIDDTGPQPFLSGLRFTNLTSHQLAFQIRKIEATLHNRQFETP